MSKTLEFKAFCFEAYRAAHNLTGHKTMALFKKYKVLDYLTACYDVLHTTGKEYLIENIDTYIKSRQKTA